MASDGLELAKEGVKETVKQMFAPVQDIMRQLLGASATEIGLMWADFFRVRRLKNAPRLFEDVKRLAGEYGFTLKPVAPHLLLPILDSASLQEDADLSRRWAALLTNAARTDYDSEILPAFPDILKQLTPEEAQFLDRVYEEATKDAERRRAEILAANPTFRGDVGFVGISGGILASAHPVLVQNLERLMLVTRTNVPLSIGDEIINITPPANHLYVSDFGRAFIRACQMPEPVKD